MTMPHAGRGDPQLTMDSFDARPVGHHGVRLALRNKWTWGPFIAAKCPRCGCTPERPCTIVLEDGCGEAACAPAGAYGWKVCSRCLL